MEVDDLVIVSEEEKLRIRNAAGELDKSTTINEASQKLYSLEGVQQKFDGLKSQIEKTKDNLIEVGIHAKTLFPMISEVQRKKKKITPNEIVVKASETFKDKLRFSASAPSLQISKETKIPFRVKEPVVQNEKTIDVPNEKVFDALSFTKDLVNDMNTKQRDFFAMKRNNEVRKVLEDGGLQGLEYPEAFAFPSPNPTKSIFANSTTSYLSKVSSSLDFQASDFEERLELRKQEKISPYRFEDPYKPLSSPQTHDPRSVSPTNSSRLAERSSSRSTSPLRVSSPITTTSNKTRKRKKKKEHTVEVKSLREKLERAEGKIRQLETRELDTQATIQALLRHILTIRKEKDSVLRIFRNEAMSRHTLTGVKKDRQDLIALNEKLREENEYYRILAESLHNRVTQADNTIKNSSSVHSWASPKPDCRAQPCLECPFVVPV
eukprot:g3266.t1